MAIYRFRISFEDYDDIIREIDVLPKHTFLDLHKALHATTGYNPDVPSSFYVSNDHWKKGDEIAYLPDDRKKDRGVILMEEARLSKFIDDPHQKFYYIYNTHHPFDFHVQLIKILKEEAGQEYPCVFKNMGPAPKLPGTASVPSSESTTKKGGDDYDFLQETEYGINEEEDFDMLDEEEQADEGKEGESEGYEDEY